MPDLDPRVIALVLIDLENAILGRPVALRSSLGSRTGRITTLCEIELEAA